MVLNEHDINLLLYNAIQYPRGLSLLDDGVWSRG